MLPVPTWQLLGSAHLVALLLSDAQVALAADHSLIEASQNLQGVTQVPTGLGLTHAVTNGPAGRAGG